MAKSPVLLSRRPGRRPLFQPGEDDGGTAGDQSITPASKRLKGSGSVVAASPGCLQILSQDDSFFEQFTDEVEKVVAKECEDEDMFAETKQQEVLTSPELMTSQILSSTPDSACSATPPSTLPLSVLDLPARALADLKAKQAAPAPAAPLTSSSALVREGRDLGPWYGLPKHVADLFRRTKGVESLFPWQERCLASPALRERNNLLYSLPTSGGKTLVAEIVMLQEILCYKRNAMLVLPFVSLVSEKIRALTPFALELGFHLEEYAGPRGRFPPVKRRHKQSLFICTIEKAHALYTSLVAEDRHAEVGVVVVDEVHMVGQEGRGAALESLITKLLYLREVRNTAVQIIAMSATVGNLTELAAFLQADLFTDNFRPVELQEFVKVGRDILKIRAGHSEQFSLARRLAEDEPGVRAVDEDGVCQLVLEVFPTHSVLVFCDSKRRCEALAELLVRVLALLGRLESALQYRRAEKAELLTSLAADGAGQVCPVLRRTVPAGIAYHHSGLTMDERKVLEEGYLTGVLGVLCCTSTLAAGVNLPARRVVIRSHLMGRVQLTPAQYRQMAGRAGRAGLDTAGESFLLVGAAQARIVPDIVAAPVERAASCLEGAQLAGLLLSCLHLGLASSPAQLHRILEVSLLGQQSSTASLSSHLAAGLSSLLSAGLVGADTTVSQAALTQQTVTTASSLAITKLGRACIAGNIDLAWAPRLYDDLAAAQPSLHVDTCLHLLYLVTPYDIAARPVYTAANFHSIYLDLQEPELAVARGLGLTEAVMVGLAVGRTSKQHKPALSRLFYALMLLDLWAGKPVHTVAAKFQVSRGEVQSLMTSAASFSASVYHFCQEVEEFWAYQDLLDQFSRRLAHCASPELLPLLDLPGVKLARARQLYKAGYTSVALLAKSTDQSLISALAPQLSSKAAAGILQAARLAVRERVETLRDEAEEAAEEAAGLSQL